MKLLFVIISLLFISTGMEAAKCTGKTPCNACTNCSKCGHCSNGGTCGTCAVGKPAKAEKKKAPKLNEAGAPVEIDTVVVKKRKK